MEDKGSSCGPFLSELKLNIDSCTNEPEAYFEALFDTSMWTTLAQEMNRITMHGRVLEIKEVLFYINCYVYFYISM